MWCKRSSGRGWKSGCIQVHLLLVTRLRDIRKKQNKKTQMSREARQRNAKGEKTQERNSNGTRRCLAATTNERQPWCHDCAEYKRGLCGKYGTHESFVALTLRAWSAESRILCLSGAWLLGNGLLLFCFLD